MRHSALGRRVLLARSGAQDLLQGERGNRDVQISAGRVCQPVGFG